MADANGLSCSRVVRRSVPAASASVTDAVALSANERAGLSAAHVLIACRDEATARCTSSSVPSGASAKATPAAGLMTGILDLALAPAVDGHGNLELHTSPLEDFVGVSCWAALYVPSVRVAATLPTELLV
jgi:hypothetical protein